MKTKITSNLNDSIKLWNSFSKDYITHMEINCLPIYFNLLSLIKVNKATTNDKILELSVGGGYGFFNLANNTNAQIYGGDISEEMVKEAKKRLALFNKNSNKLIDLDIINNEDLSRFQDNTFRNVISNFSIHLVHNPLVMLKETHRVLNKNDPNNSAAFSAPGRAENCSLFSLIPQSIKECGFEIPINSKAMHGLSQNKDEVYQLCREAGFNKITLEYTSCLLNYSNEKEIDIIIDGPMGQQMFKGLDEDKIEKVKEKYRNNIAKELKDNRKIKNEALLFHLH